jgi:hypothetical protein
MARNADERRTGGRVDRLAAVGEDACAAAG